MAQGGPHDLTGQLFGRLVAKERIPVKNGVSRGAWWLCLCACGNTITTRARSLVHGVTSSCGCLQREKAVESGKGKLIDISGRTFGWLTVIDRTESRTKRARWNCICKCGKKTVASGNSLKRGVTISCGCAKGKTSGAPVMTPESRLRANAASHNRRARAQESGGTFTVEDVKNRYEWQNGRCAGAGCGIRLKGVYHIDHIEPLSPRYSQGKRTNLNDKKNIQLLCSPCNWSKNARDPIAWAQSRGLLL